MTLVLTLAGIVALSLPACASAAAPTARLVWAGTYTIPAEGVLGQIDAAAPIPPVRLVKDWVLEREGPAVAAELNTRFGIRYAFEGPRAGARIRHRVLWYAPPPASTDPVTGTTLDNSGYDINMRCNAKTPCSSGTVIEKPWDLVPGQWRVEVWFKDQKLLEYAFAVSLK